jgi:peptide/nickel transport system substrate-binding protein
MTPGSLGRRTLLAAATTGLLSAPRIARADGARVIKFIPQSDLAVLDPIWTQAYVTRNHGLMVFDTLYGIDENFVATQQMVHSHSTEDGGLTWTLVLRAGQRWHDGERVLGRDCVASLRRWGARDSFGQTLMALVDELSAPDDHSIRFRLKRPFPLLPDALGKAGSNIAAMMPERLAQTDPFKPITEMIGSGPFRFKADERVAGSLVVYERNPDYIARQTGRPSFTSGPKNVHVDRVEWHVIPDAATAAAALQTGEVDWWEAPTPDLLPLLRRNKDIQVRVQDHTGYLGNLRFNQLQPPFDNPALRRAVVGAVSQEDYMSAAAGTDPASYRTGVGYFCPGTPMASDVGMDALTGPRDLDRVRKAVAASGYKGERVVVPVPTDFPSLKALGDVGADMFRKIGLNVDYQASDWGTLLQRMAKMDPVEQGGWSAFHTFWSGLDQLNPAVNAFLRGNGRAAARGWPTSERIEALREQWLVATSLQDQKSIAADIQQQAFVDVPYVPLGQYLAATAYRRDITDVLGGFAMFWNLRRIS